MDEFLTIARAAELLSINPETLRRWDKTGKFPCSRHPINNYRIYTVEQIEKLRQEIKGNMIDSNAALDPEPQPCFETKSGKLYNLDAVKFIGSLPSESVDLIFADPPYNIKKAQWDTFNSQRQYVYWCMEWIEEGKRVLTSQGSMYICGFSEILADIKWNAAPLFRGCKWIVWYYRNKANMGNNWGRSHESLLHFRKSKDFIFNVDEVRTPYNDHTLKYPSHPQAESSQYGNGKKYVWSPHPKGARPKDVFEIPTISNSSWEKMKHPTQKPVELVKKCVLASSNPGCLVADPFGGTGTTYAVCEAFGRKWLGSENNLDYCRIIKSRLLDREHISRISEGEDDIKSQKLRAKLRG